MQVSKVKYNKNPVAWSTGKVILRRFFSLLWRIAMQMVMHASCSGHHAPFSHAFTLVLHTLRHVCLVCIISGPSGVVSKREIVALNLEVDIVAGFAYLVIALMSCIDNAVCISLCALVQ
jgi:hypothetical protein